MAVPKLGDIYSELLMDTSDMEAVDSVLTVFC